MGVVFASFWHVTGMVCTPPPGPVRGPPRGPVSPHVHTYEDQHDHQEDDQQKHPIAREDDDTPAQTIRDTGHRYLAPTEQSGVARPTVSRYVLNTGRSSY